MSLILLNMEPAGAPASPSTAGKIVFTGRRRKHIRQLLKLLQTITNEDLKEESKAQKGGYQAATFTGGPTSFYNQAMAQLMSRADECIRMRGSFYSV